MGAKVTAMAKPTTDGSRAPDVELVGRPVLNAHLWTCIFAFLDTKARVRVEMLNKSLASLTVTFWRRQAYFDATAIKTRSARKQRTPRCACLRLSTSRAIVSRAPSVVTVCTRIGGNIRSLKLSSTLEMDWSTEPSAIAKACPNIDTIDFHVVNWVPLELRFDSFANLKRLSFTSSSKGADGGRAYLEVSASTFLSIPLSIETVVGARAASGEQMFETAEQLENFFAHRPLLKEVRLAYLTVRDGSEANVFPLITERCPCLKTIELRDSDIDLAGIASLAKVKELRLFSKFPRNPSNDDIIAFCRHSPFIERLVLGGTVCETLRLPAFEAMADLTNLRELSTVCLVPDLTVEQVTSFVRKLGRNSGASLRSLELLGRMHLSTAAVEALAMGCTQLRHLEFLVNTGEATPASIRGLIDCIIADPSWNPRQQQLEIIVSVSFTAGDYSTALALYRALNDPVANMPIGVQLRVA